MANPMKTTLALLFFAASTQAFSAAQAQSVPYSDRQTEVAAEYSYLRSNAPPGGCGCFSLNGGSISIAQPVRSGHFAFVVDATIDHGSQIASGSTAGGYDLTLAAFTGGVRYRPKPHARWNPFAEVLVGGAHVTGSLVQGPTPAASDPALVFASNIGGGLDRRLSYHWSVRLIEADYLLTTSTNSVNDHQNNLRISVGATYRFGRR